MKNKKLFVGIVQIVLGIGIFCGGGMVYYFKTNKADFSAVRLAALIKQTKAMRDICVNLQTTIPQHEKSLGNLNKSLVPLKNSVDAIVNLRDYTIMKKKPFYSLGNSFVGFQKSIQEVRDSITSAQSSFNEIYKIQSQELIPAEEAYIKVSEAELDALEQWQKNDIYTLYCLLGIFAFAGLGILSNGIQNCICKD